MIVTCSNCLRRFDDEYRLTTCPHKTFPANDGKNNFAHHSDSYLEGEMEHFAEDYTERNEQIETMLKDIGRTIEGQMPPGWGFTLLMYTYDKGAMFYISSGERDGMIKSMEEMLTNLRKSNH